MRFGYGTNGFGDHSLDEALSVIADLGYAGVGLTLDRRHLDPYADHLPRHLSRIAHRLDELGLDVVIETGGRYLLDPWHKHHPTLLSAEGAGRRVDLLSRAVRIAAELGAPVVSFWSGIAPEGEQDTVLWDRLKTGCDHVLVEAERYGITLGFEPEPGMFVDTLDRFDELHASLGAPERLGLTLDIGHCRCLEPQSVPECVRRAAPRLVNVQIEDMRRGAHEHLEFGEGEIDFPPVLSELHAVGYRGLVSVELPRHSHAAPSIARRSLDFLRAAAPPPASGLAAGLPAPAAQWLADAREDVRADPGVVTMLFPTVSRSCGRGRLPGTDPSPVEWTVDDAVRALLLDALPLSGPPLYEAISRLYQEGDTAERRAVLRALPLLDHGDRVGDLALPLVREALRSNDPALVEAALGAYAARRLDDAGYRQAVLKCVFTGIPLARVEGLGERTDRELVRMLADFARERLAAGRDVPDDILPLLRSHPEAAAGLPGDLLRTADAS
ncbi:sugar phosphate isomerase/epimerase [Streptomyces sp. A244]|nr:sugar phosphate isomerase/epimerase [Streptomyces sp. A244]